MVRDIRVERVRHLDDRYHIARACERVAVVVLGDVGRSPRTVYHALALADAGIVVDLVGNADTPLEPAAARHPRIVLHVLRTPASAAPGVRFVARAAWRAVRQSIELLALLRRLPPPDALLVQNPPAVPTLLIAWLVARARGARLIVDWHNFGYAMLTVRLPRSHPAVRLARAYERAVGRLADHHLCVSRAMADTLAVDLGVQGVIVLHDRPAARFAPADAAGRAALRARFAAELGLPPLDREAAWVVSPTGWTPDEDLALLIDAVARCDAALASGRAANPDVILILTGEGPLRAQWTERLARLELRRVHVRAHWLAADDYPRLLAAADLGVSVHRSTSGCDLPMKIADLHGAGVPVCALDYGPCLSEMLIASEEPWRFGTAEGLSSHLLRLLEGFPDGATELDAARAALAAAPVERWSDAWKALVAPLFVCEPARDVRA
ncbi:glycosyltransferase [Candidatus Binatia bacterium]|nr:glycosyltransferase [Candidatus Binatia bacterium]